jgi:hypothetical protein
MNVVLPECLFINNVKRSRIMVKLMISTGLCLMLLACADKHVSDDLDKGRVMDEVTEMLHQYHSDIEKYGLTGEFKYLDQSSDFFWIPPGFETVLNYDTVRNILEVSAPKYRSVSFQWDTLEVHPLSNDIATFSGIVTGIMTDTSGAKVKTSMIESGSLIRRSDGWKLLCGQSAIINPER